MHSIDPAIRFTVEGNHENGCIPFLDTLVTPQAENSLSITVYHKPTHTNQYLQWGSHHNISAKYSVIGTLTHRAKAVCTGPEFFQKELQHLREVLSSVNITTGPSVGCKVNTLIPTKRITMTTTAY